MRSASRLTLSLVVLLAASLCAQDVNLPSPQKNGGMPLMEALAKRSSAREFDARPLTSQQLSGLLWACFGINREDGKRTAPSAKNNQEMDIYVLQPSGAYLYDAQNNKLKLTVNTDLRALGATQDFATNAPVILVLVADQSKMGKWTPEEKRNYAYVDAGYISQNAYLFCASEGLVTGARASVDRKALGQKLGLRPDQLIVLAHSVGYPKP